MFFKTLHLLFVFILFKLVWKFHPERRTKQIIKKIIFNPIIIFYLTAHHPTEE